MPHMYNSTEITICTQPVPLSHSAWVPFSSCQSLALHIIQEELNMASELASHTGNESVSKQ